MQLYSASAFGFIGGTIHPRGSAMTAIPIGQSGTYDWNGVTHVTVPTQTASASGYQTWPVYTGTGTANGSMWKNFNSSRPNVDTVTFPITGTGWYTAYVPWTYSFNYTSETGVMDREHDYLLYASADAYIEKYQRNYSSKLYLKVSNTGLETSYASGGIAGDSYTKSGAYTAYYSGGIAYYQQWTRNQTALTITSTRTSSFPSGEGTGGTVGDEDIIGTGASSVVSLGSAIELYGIYP
jgi:hypothetical protein